MENAANFTKTCAIRMVTHSRLFYRQEEYKFVLTADRIQMIYLSSNCLNRPELNFVGYRTFPAETT